MPPQAAKPSGFFTFGTGLLIGMGAAMGMRATMPRATEVVGLMMQKMGFEIGDILLALWDPEAQQAALVPSVAALPVPKKRAIAKQAAQKRARRYGKEPAQESTLKLPLRTRATTPAKPTGKPYKLPFSRRHFRSAAAVRLN
jgi:hypothetical protein